ncbi:MAG: hypothetical protein PWP51_1776 [Clostridiales bacterium]|nr:hypothetical protein [Clostridiales bacterium]
MKTHRIYSIVLMVIGSIAVFSGGTLPYTIFLTLLLLRLILWLTLRLNAKNLVMLCYTRNIILTAGDAIDVEYKATNTGLVPIAHAKIAFQFSEKMDAVTPLKEIAFFKSYQLINFSKRVHCLYHGYYRVGRVEVTLYDLLRLGSYTLKFDKDVAITVQPRIFELSYFDIDATAVMGTLSSRRRDLTDRSSIANIRAYERGDAQKDIHWKISAKREMLLTKQYEQALRQKCVILLDGYHGYAERGFSRKDEEMLVSFAGSLSHQMMQRDIYTRLYLNSQHVDGNNASHFVRFLEALTGFDMTDDMRFEDKVRAALVKEGLQQQYFLISPDLRQSTLEMMLALKQSGVAATLFVKTKKNAVTDELMASAEHYAINIVPISEGR